MTFAPRYPAAQWIGNGRVYGNYVPAWNEKGFLPRVVLHTTETPGLPGYDGGNIAPHITYDPKYRKFYQHAEFTGSVGALRDETGGIRTNRDGSLQIEIICYSAKSIADASTSRLWVGDLSDEALSDIADFIFWTFEEWGVPLRYHPLTGLYRDSKAYGTKSASRIPDNQWDFRIDAEGKPWGICGHRNVPENNHWDPGALNLEKIMDYIGKRSSVASPFTDVPEGHPFYNDIQWMFETKISTGYSGGRAGQYGPDDYVTRAQMAAFLRRALSDATTVEGLKRGLAGVEFSE